MVVVVVVSMRVLLCRGWAAPIRQQCENMGVVVTRKTK